MDPAIARTSAPSFAFEDGLGKRHHTSDAGNQPLEILTLREELTSVPSFEFALRERASRLAGFRHASYSHIRGIDKTGNALAVVCDRVHGTRLSEILTVAEQQLLPVDIDAALCLIRQLVQATAMLHEQVPDVCHGALAPERIIVTPNARLVIVEHVLGAALGQLLYSRERYWKDLRIAMPPRAGSPRFDRRADVTQVGAISLALILGRPLAEDEYPQRIAEIVERVGAVSPSGGLEPLPTGVRSWLARALQLDPRNSFASAVEARTDLDAVLRDADFAAAPAALEEFLAQYEACVGMDSSPFVMPSAPPAAPVASSKPPAPPQMTAAPPAPPIPKVEAPAPVAHKPAAAHVPPPPVKPESGVHRQPGAHRQSGAHQLPEHLAPQRPVMEAEHEETPMRPASSNGGLIAAAAVFVVVVLAGVLGARQYFASSAATEPGTLVVTTNPPGVTVVIDGKTRGETPLTASLAPGEHVLELLGNDNEPRRIPVKITPGGQVSQFLELPKVAPVLGKLQIRTEPSGAKVTVDGHVYGRAPVTIDELTPGSHQVTLENDLGSVRETVTIEPGATASLVVPMAAPQGAPVSGWIAVNAPVDVQIFESGKLLGSSKSDRIMVSVGRHDLELVNEAVGYRGTQSVNVTPGQLSTVRPDWPKGAMALNALPWADVFIDGKLVGETPIGNIAVPIGPHEIIFRHPDLGEQRVNTIVTFGTPARLSVDLRKK